MSVWKQTAASCAPFLFGVYNSFVNKKWFSCNQVIILMFCVFVIYSIYTKWKDAISQFPVSPDNTGITYVKWKITCVLIPYFLSSISATNYQNRLMYVEVIARATSVLFLKTQCTNLFTLHYNISSLIIPNNNYKCNKWEYFTNGSYEY